MHVLLRSKPFWVLFLATALAALASLLAFSVGSANPGTSPEVNGLFFGDGDNANYIYLSEYPERGKLYYRLDGEILYVAVTVDRAINDNVFGDTSDDSDTLYVQSVGWSGGGANHNFRALERSEHLQFRLSCDAGAIDETWIHGYVYDLDGDKDPYEDDWRSGPDDDSTGGPYPTEVLLIDTASSLMWNLNNFADMDGSPAWDITLITNGDPPRTSDTTYKSPGGGADDEDVTDEVGYPPAGPITFDTANGWEWPLVYEFSADTSACAGTPMIVQVVSAHNSPSKGDEDVPIGTVDFGDLPDSYGTTTAGDGARHQIELNGPMLGGLIDGEIDGQPTGNAIGDDDGGSADEDGVAFELDDTDWSAGSGEMDFTISGGDACLDVWVDFADDLNMVVDNGDGDFFDGADGISEHVIVAEAVSNSDPQPVNITFALPEAINNGTSLAVRTRLTPRDVAGGCGGAAYIEGAAGPVGYAIGGEVEDNIIELPTPTSTGLSDFGPVTGGLNSGWLIAAALIVVIPLGLLFRRRATKA